MWGSFKLHSAFNNDPPKASEKEPAPAPPLVQRKSWRNLLVSMIQTMNPLADPQPIRVFIDKAATAIAEPNYAVAIAALAAENHATATADGTAPGDPGAPVQRRRSVSNKTFSFYPENSRIPSETITETPLPSPRTAAPQAVAAPKKQKNRRSTFS